MSRKASAPKRQSKVAGKKKLVLGEDFAAPDPISSVLPRIKVTRTQEDELLEWISKGRNLKGRNSSNDGAATLREVFADADLTNRVQQALQFYIHDVEFLSDVPEFRRCLITLEEGVARILAALPHEHDSVGYFLKRTYTGEIFLKDQLRPTDERFVELEEAWSGKHGVAAIRNSLVAFQKNIDVASSLLSGTRPRAVAVERFVLSLAYAWEAATGQWPKSGRDEYHSQSGPFADFVWAASSMLPIEYHIRRLDHAIRSVCARNKPRQPKAKRT